MNAEFTVDRRSLSSALARLVKTAGSKKHRKQQLATAQVNVNGNVSIGTTNLESSQTIVLDAEDFRGSAIVRINIHDFAKVVRAQKSKSLIVSCSDDGIEVGTAALASPYPDSECPSTRTAEFKVDATWAGKSEELVGYVTKTSYATDEETFRYALGGVLFEIKNHSSITLVATDGRRLAMASDCISTAVDEFDSEQGAHGIAPAAFMTALTKALAKTETVKIELGTERIRATTFDKHGEALSHLESRLLEGRFPSWRKVIDRKEIANVAMVDANDLLEAMEQCKSIDNPEERGIDFTFENGLLCFEYKTPTGKVTRSINAPAWNSAIPYKFTALLNYLYLRDIAKSSKDLVVEISGDSLAKKNSRPVYFDGRGFTAIVMPMD